MRIRVIIGTVAFVLLASIAAYAYTAVNATATVNVKEPLVVNDAFLDSGSPNFTSIGSCTISSDLHSATCTVDQFAGEQGRVNVRLRNLASVQIHVTQTASASSPDVTLTIANPTATIDPAPSGAFLFQILYSISSSATPGPFTITTSFSR